ncbi:MAG TPA: ATP-binding protein [Kofleriaceae bacterium]|nr:ATP-binding protein [Kofleriaceae bacterium]
MERTLDFARDSDHLVVASTDGLHVVDVRGRDAPVRFAIDRVHAFTAMGDELWVVAGESPQLTRYALRTGEALDAPVGLSSLGTDSRLVRAAGAPAAVWLGETAMTIAKQGAGVVARELAPDVELVLPVSATRALWCQRHAVSLREGTSTRWTATPAREGRIVDGAILSDGRSAAFVVQKPGSQAIIVIGLRDGTVLHRINLAGVSPVRFAARRGVALVLSEQRRLVIVDLRFGRITVDHEVDRDVAELAIDEAGQQVALRIGDRFGDVEQITVRDLAAATKLGAMPAPPVEPSLHVAQEEDEPVVDGDAATNGHPVAETTAAAVARAPDPFASTVELGVIEGLAPRVVREPATPEETRHILGVHRELALSLVALAIARGWDEGRIAFPNSSSLPFRSEVEGVTGTLRGLATEDVAEAARRTELAGADAEAAEAAIAPRLSPLAALVDEVKLSPLERDILLVVAAPVVWGELARLYGVLANDEGRPLCDEQLVVTILAERATPYDVAAALDPDAPLVRYGVIRVGAGVGRPFLPLFVDRVVLKMLRGGSPVPELAPTIQPRAATRTLAQLRVRGAVKDRAVHELERARAPIRIAVRGRVGSGRHTLLATIAASARRELGVIDASMMIRDPRARTDELRMALERAHLAGLLPCVDGLDLIASDDAVARDQVREVLRRHPGPLAVRLGWEAQPPLDPGHVLVDLPTQSISERMASWQESLEATGLRVSDVGELADRYAVGPGVIHRVCLEVAEADREAKRALEDDAGGRLDHAVRQHLESRLGTTANRVQRLATWAQVILPSDILDSLTELIARIRHRRTVFDAWGFDRVLSTARGVTALFSGGPGTGKTLVASAIANELGMDLYRVDLSRVMSKWIGETEQNLAKLFDAAEDGNAIILFDEADSLFAKRTEVKSSVDRYANLEVNYLLQRFDTFEGIAILTTNFGTSIDSAFKRRLSLRLTFPFPDEDQRERLWRAHMPPEAPVSGDFDLADIARRYRLSGGYIRNCALRAAFIAAEEGGALTNDHLERAIKAEFREIGKLAESGVLE